MQQAVRRLMPGLGTRAQDTPKLEFTSLLRAKCKEDDVREVAEDRGVQPVHEFRGAEDGDAPGRLLPKGATVEFHSLRKNGLEYNGRRGTIHKANRNTTGEHEYIVKIVKKPGDTIEEWRVSQTHIKLVEENS